ncbi:flagellar hook protein FlgE [Salinarimonas sp. NSM]|uniref:flagellar hook protein FlgE n=1 Tax=Salinarimonas sp. NSM TaxID=3458003 RepID=UPI0040351C8B
MGSFGSLLTAVAGLRSQSFSMQNISGNIANSSTPGFKRVDTSFVDLVPEQPITRQVSGSVNAFSRATNTLTGSYLPTNIDTNVALNGQGFFVVGQPPVATTTVVRQSPELYTRRGDFELDRQGYMVNGAGYALRGTMLDRTTGAPLPNQQGGFIQITQELLGRLDPNPTSTVNYQASLPTNPGTVTAQGGGAAEMAPAGGPAAITEAQETDFLNSTLPGGSVTVYNAVGAIGSMNLRWGRLTNDPATGSTWALYYESRSGTPTDTWRRLDTDAVSFNTAGAMTGPADGALSSGTDITINNVVFQPVDINIQGGMTVNDTGGSVIPSFIEQNGFGVGRYESVAISEEGVVSIAYSNGQVRPVAELSLVGFFAPNALRRVDGGAFEATRESGDPSVAFARGTVLAGGVESSNVDISEEFAKMIVTQQAYTANTRVISASQEMIRDVLNVVR